MDTKIRWIIETALMGGARALLIVPVLRKALHK